MTDNATLGYYSPKSTLQDVYDKFADLGNAKDFFYHWGGFNEWLFKAINGLRPGAEYDNVMLLINKLGDKMNFPYFVAGLLIYVLLSSLLRKARRKGAVRARLVMWFGIFSVLCVGFACELLVFNFLKDYFALPRPYVVFPPSEVTLLEIRGAEDAYRSFPSGHTGFITVIIMSLWPLFADRWRWFTLLIIGAVAWARISLGVHFPADVLGGFIIATLLIIAVRYVIYTLYRKLLRLHC